VTQVKAVKEGWGSAERKKATEAVKFHKCKWMKRRAEEKRGNKKGKIVAVQRAKSVEGWMRREGERSGNTMHRTACIDSVGPKIWRGHLSTGCADDEMAPLFSGSTVLTAAEH